MQLPGVSATQAVQTIGTTQKLYFATSVPGAPDPSSASFIADQQGLFDPSQFSNPTLYPTGSHWKIDNNLQATDVNSATVGQDATSGAIAVDINFNSAGATEWAKITNAAYAVYQTDPTSPNAQIAIFLDNRVLTAPQVTGGGQSNQTEITGNFTSDSATQLASLISAGALPADITTVASTTVSATLGQQSITLSLIAGAHRIADRGHLHDRLLPIPGRARDRRAVHLCSDRPGALQAHPGDTQPRWTGGLRAQCGNGGRCQRAHIRTHP